MNSMIFRFLFIFLNIIQQLTTQNNSFYSLAFSINLNELIDNNFTIIYNKSYSHATDFNQLISIGAIKCTSNNIYVLALQMIHTHSFIYAYFMWKL